MPFSYNQYRPILLRRSKVDATQGYATPDKSCMFLAHMCPLPVRGQKDPIRARASPYPYIIADANMKTNLHADVYDAC